MSIWHYIQEQLIRVYRRSRPKSEQRYDNVQITNAVDGATIKGHEAVKAYLEQEKRLADENGLTIIFQVYRINLQAEDIKQLQSEKLAEIKVDGSFVSGNDTVAVVIEKARSLLKENNELQGDVGSNNRPLIKDTDNITLYFGGRPMQNSTLFYADNFVMLPAWVQVMIHACEFGELISIVKRLNKG